MVITGQYIADYRLFALRVALRLESKGMKRRGRSALAIIKAETGLKARTAAAMLPLFDAWLAAHNVGRRDEE